ncbi:Nif11 domain/cupin domain-containing protein [Cyanobium sp. WAJ14-Wanaka]|uniref:Nif11 domain/cupin domain-containing protein n=1 Tax=Cyanobium sp. WAJ14-Wanaka TaxID=2823725 RepID=UPI0020CC4E0F|nr:Nif11 domain/cupin domain-containing protein [Cyanobium sp. WAJ14-Wanaka]MCP9774992.1 Nif11 domain/cupin domain-containing protein [Cyanobium sp. WAJ14-Wanaka]
MAQEQLLQFLEKVRQLNQFVALTEAQPALRQQLEDCSNHQQVVNLAREHGLEIGRRWGELQQPEQPAKQSNIFSSPCPPPGHETHQLLIEQPGLRIEQIHSCGYASPRDFWYDQPEQEWVLLMQGCAELQFEDEAQSRHLGPGDSLLIGAHRRHRLVATDPAPGCVWLALFWPVVGAG